MRLPPPPIPQDHAQITRKSAVAEHVREPVFGQEAPTTPSRVAPMTGRTPHATGARLWGLTHS